MRRTIRTCIALALAVVLAACRVDREPSGPRPTPTDVTARLLGVPLSAIREASVCIVQRSAEHYEFDAFVRVEMVDVPTRDALLDALGLSAPDAALHGRMWLGYVPTGQPRPVWWSPSESAELVGSTRGSRRIGLMRAPDGPLYLYINEDGATRAEWPLPESYLEHLAEFDCPR